VPLTAIIRNLLFFGLLLLTFPTAVLAQCASNASSCVTCHESQGQFPVLQSEATWHIDHGFGDLCAGCHGGDPESPQKDLAHQGLRNPLADAAVSCAGCHTNAEELATSYRALERPKRSPSVAPVSNQNDLDSGITIVDGFLVAAMLLLSLVIFRLIRPRQKSWGELLRDPEWNPYLAGGLLGSVVAFSAIVCGRPLAASGAFDRLAAYPGQALFPESQYYQFIMSPGITWQVWMIVGLLGGSFVSSKLSGQARLRWLPDTQWVERFGTSRTTRFVLAFLGAVLVQLGAGIAGGCTSGLAISGGAVLAPGAFIFMAGMFLGGIPTALFWYRGRS